jgi:hypothetical protein
VTTPPNTSGNGDVAARLPSFTTSEEPNRALQATAGSLGIQARVWPAAPERRALGRLGSDYSDDGDRYDA